jgi:hypothetical protein
MAEPRRTNYQGGRDKTHFDLNPDQPIAPNAQGARGARHITNGRRAMNEVCALLRAPMRAPRPAPPVAAPVAVANDVAQAEVEMVSDANLVAPAAHEVEQSAPQNASVSA